jgi:hypothetical protein
MSVKRKSDSVDPLYIITAKIVAPIVMGMLFIAMIIYMTIFYPHLPTKVWFEFFGGRVGTIPIAYSNDGLLLQVIVSFAVGLIIVLASRIISRSSKNNTAQSLSVVLAILPPTILVSFMFDVFIWATWQVDSSLERTYEQARQFDFSAPWSLIGGVLTVATLAVFLFIPYYLIKKSAHKTK